MPLTVAIVGRPNVGKSTLFNRLAGKKLAIVDDTPGVTRDRAFAESDFGGLHLALIDTAGFDKGAPESLVARMAAQTNAAIADADVCLFVVDARAGVTPGDEIVAQALRRSGKPVILAANKCEGRLADAGATEAYALGFGEPIALSAEHGMGLAELQQALAAYESDAGVNGEPAEAAETDAADRPLRLAIVGRPNVGKSSLLNRLIGEERSLTGPEAGITRDAVLAEWHHDGRDILLHDTAGLRKKARISERLEKLSVGSTLNAVRFADCVIVVMDANEALEKQDLAIAALIASEGRGIVFAVNKWDLVKDRNAAFKALRERVDRLLPQIAGAPIVGVSALTGEGMERLIPAVLEAERVWNTRVSTHKVNRFLEGALAQHPPPAIHGRRVRIRYMTQAKARPPTFVLFGNQLKELPESYLRYLVNGMRVAFEMPGTPIRINLRGSKNPYADK
ncbi:MAG TPA: ribosome biogenesis GTPase Der [Micropepsaceae bacterium]|jgi:GTP-binding protein|nr:ribosome biogenesis GTPase Der [Micropepsaceae bacterium]